MLFFFLFELNANAQHRLASLVQSTGDAFKSLASSPGSLCSNTKTSTEDLLATVSQVQSIRDTSIPRPPSSVDSEVYPNLSHSA